MKKVISQSLITAIAYLCRGPTNTECIQFYTADKGARNHVIKTFYS